jgi:hypothetical protein
MRIPDRITTGIAYHWIRRVVGVSATLAIVSILVGVTTRPTFGGGGSLLPNATITASPNPVFINPISQAPKAVSLSWNTGNPNLSGQINIGQCGGQTVGNANPTGTASYDVTLGGSYLFVLCDPSGNVLITTTVTSENELRLGLPTATPAASNVQLNPAIVRNSWNASADQIGGAYCNLPSYPGEGLPDVGTAPQPIDPSAVTNESAVVFGYAHHYDPGSQPAPCGGWNVVVYRGAVGFDMGRVNSFIQAHGLKSATLEFSLIPDQGSTPNGDLGCLSQIQVSDNSWDKPESQYILNNASFNGLTGGSEHTQYPQVSDLAKEAGSGPYTPNLGVADAMTVDVTSLVTLQAAFGGQPNMHFIFVGSVESLSEPNDNNECMTIFGNFLLNLVPDH